MTCHLRLFSTGALRSVSHTLEKPLRGNKQQRAPFVRSHKRNITTNVISPKTSPFYTPSRSAADKESSVLGFNVHLVVSADIPDPSTRTSTLAAAPITVLLEEELDEAGAGEMSKEKQRQREMIDSTPLMTRRHDRWLPRILCVSGLQQPFPAVSAGEEGPSPASGSLHGIRADAHPHRRRGPAVGDRVHREPQETNCKGAGTALPPCSIHHALAVEKVTRVKNTLILVVVGGVGCLCAVPQSCPLGDVPAAVPLTAGGYKNEVSTQHFPAYPGVDRFIHTGDFYVVRSGKVEAIFTSQVRAEEMTRGVRGSSMVSAPTWGDAMDVWTAHCIFMHQRTGPCACDEYSRTLLWGIKGVHCTFTSKKEARDTIARQALGRRLLICTEDSQLLSDFIQDAGPFAAVNVET
ncbi:hypothetical protein B0H13DRAFT_2360246 [Mycena leptocephala]|nr:hypothetical protein B0H13DRAFT_2360246 [Mycena leptocephala]